MSTRSSFDRWWKRHTHHLRRRNDKKWCKECAEGCEEPRLRKEVEQTDHYDGHFEWWYSVRLK